MVEQTTTGGKITNGNGVIPTFRVDGDKVEKIDNVSHPKHYEGSTSLECIEAMRMTFGVDAVKDFCLCNSFKYVWRWKNKNGTEDLKKGVCEKKSVNI